MAEARGVTDGDFDHQRLVATTASSSRQKFSRSSGKIRSRKLDRLLQCILTAEPLPAHTTAHTPHPQAIERAGGLTISFRRVGHACEPGHHARHRRYLKRAAETQRLVPCLRCLEPSAAAARAKARQAWLHASARSAGKTGASSQSSCRRERQPLVLNPAHRTKNSVVPQSNKVNSWV